ILLAKRCLLSLIRLLRSKQLSRKTKVRPYSQIILPVLLYGSECRRINYNQELYSKKDLNPAFAVGSACRNDGRTSILLLAGFSKKNWSKAK
uniref:Uncharacterized protein n=1 Tax=Megaselia scalaris TaxID=36166 RepID=T1H1N1_MEGSC